MVIRFNVFVCDSRVKNILEAIFNNVLGALLDVVEIMKTRLQRIRKNDSTINKLKKKNISIGIVRRNHDLECSRSSTRNSSRNDVLQVVTISCNNSREVAI